MTSRDAEVILDVAAIAIGSVAIALAAHNLAFMTVFIPALWLGRLGAWWLVTHHSHRSEHLPGRRRAALAAETFFLALCTLLGGFNDWSSVVHHRIYDYTVPHAFPGFSTIPIWMLIFWGLILRFLATLSTWARLGDATARLGNATALPRDGVRLGRRLTDHPWLKITLQLVLVLATRQAVYRWYADPVLSWAPFAAAALLYAFLFGLSRRELLLGGLVLVGGPLIEVLYIQVAGLHRYHLGWLGGVPLWIALWWVMALWVWSDLSPRIRRTLNHWLGA